MSAPFDPYHKWLGILPKDQPPHHYRLLGLEPFEDDLQVIEAAADRQLSFLRKFQSGEHAADCQKLLNELARARLCLLKPATKAAYDQELRAKLAAPQGIAFDFEPEIDDTAAARPHSKLNSQPGPVVWISAGVLLLLLLGGIGYFFTGGQPENKPVSPDVVQDEGPTTKAGTSPDASGASVVTGIKDATQSGTRSGKQLPPGTTNVLPLLKAENIALGSWDIKPDRLESLAYNKGAHIWLPVSAPAEYTLHIEATPLEKSKTLGNLFAVGLVCGEGNCLFAMDADPNTGGAGLEIIDDKDWNRNSTTLPGVFTTPNVPFQIDAIVRQDGIEIRKDGRTLVDWRGSLHRLKRPPGVWYRLDPQRLFLSAEPRYAINHITLGPPLPRRELPGRDLKPNASVELLKFVDIRRDVWNGEWERNGLAMKSSAKSSAARFGVPFQVPDEYELVADVQSEGTGNTLFVGVPFQNGHAGVGIGAQSSIANSLMIDYSAFWAATHMMQRELALVPGKNRVVVTVRKNHLIVQANDKTLFDWKGDARRFIAWPEYVTPGQQVVIGSDKFSYQLNSLRLTRLEPSADVLAKPGEPKNGDLLGIIDLERDTTHGNWKKTEKGFASSSYNTSGLLFPAKVPANYEFRVAAELKEGNESIMITFPVAGRAVMGQFGFEGGAKSGICWMEGKSADINSTTVSHAENIFPVGHATVISGRVEGRHLKVEVDGKPVWDLDIPDTLRDEVWMVRPGWLTREERLQLSISSWRAGFELQEVRFRSLDSQSPPFPPVKFAKSSHSNNPADANPQAGSSAGTLPVPDTATQEAASKKLHEIFKDEFASARRDTDKMTLAQKLEELADDSGNDSATKFVCLEEARKLSAQAGDLTKAFIRIDKLCGEFKLDPLELQSSTLISVAAKLKGPLLNRELVDRALPLVDQLAAVEKFDVAMDLVTAAIQSGSRVKDKSLTSDLNDIRRETDAVAKEFAAAEKARQTLTSNPDDPAARLLWGLWLCFHKDDWPAGLKLLEGADDEKLRQLASRDLKGPANNEEIAQLGTDWLEYAKSKKDHSLAKFAVRALYWLSRAYAEATGPLKTRLESLVEQSVAVRDWNSPGTSLLDLVNKKVTQQKFVASAESRIFGGEVFRDIPAEGGVLIGFNCYLGGHYDFTVIRGIEPVYATKRGLKIGSLQGGKTGDVVEIRAREGYAVCNIAHDANQAHESVHSIRVIFARMIRTGLDAKRTYNSDVVGAIGNPNVWMRTAQDASAPIVGFFGRANDILRSYGVIFTK